MRASVHIADLGSRSLLEAARRRPKVGQVPGLLDARLATASPLRRSVVPSTSLRRLALVSMWEDDAAIDAFEAEHPVALAMSSGWRIRLEPLRGSGSWPGLPESLPTERSAGADDLAGPFAVLTLARTRMSRIVRFLRTSQPAETAAVTAPGFLWGTAVVLPPFFATVSLWESSRALSTYAYGRSQPAHHDAIEVDKAKPFHHDAAFVRFRPYASSGALGGKNPLPSDWAPTPASD